MTRQTVNKMCWVLEPDLSPMENTVRDAIGAQKQVVLTVYSQLGIYLVWQNPSHLSAFSGSVKLKLKITCMFWRSFL